MGFPQITLPATFGFEMSWVTCDIPAFNTSQWIFPPQSCPVTFGMSRCPLPRQLRNAPAQSHLLCSLVKLLPTSSFWPPSPDAGTELLFLVVLLHGIHDFIGPHLPLPGRGVLAQLIIFYTQVIPYILSPLLLPCSEPLLGLLYKMHLSWRSQNCIPYSARGQQHNDVLCFALFSLPTAGLAGASSTSEPSHWTAMPTGSKGSHWVRSRYMTHCGVRHGWRTSRNITLRYKKKLLHSGLPNQLIVSSQTAHSLLSVLHKTYKTTWTRAKYAWVVLSYAQI